jgi:hypothetical protein
MEINAENMQQIVTILGSLASVLNGLGVSGLIALVLSGPVIVLGTILMVEYKRGRDVNNLAEAMRKENREILEGSRLESSRLLEVYRADTHNVLGECRSMLQSTTKFYNDNVVLVKDYERLANNLQDVVVTNTKAIERLCVMMEGKNSAYKGENYHG